MCEAARGDMSWRWGGARVRVHVGQRSAVQSVGVCGAEVHPVHGPAPEGDTDQRFAVHSAMCVWVWRGWSPRTRSRGGQGSVFCRAECNVSVGLAGLDKDLANQRSK